MFHFAKLKGRQNGEDHVGPLHVYVNPHGPHILPVLLLSRYLFAYPELLVNKTSLYQGKFQYNRYPRMFLLLIKDNLEHLKTLGIQAGDIGMYSCRKGVANMVAAGFTMSPPIVLVCIRAGWVVGGVKEKYLRRESTGDQYVGRCASGLEQLEKRLLLHLHTLISLRSRKNSKIKAK